MKHYLKLDVVRATKAVVGYQERIWKTKFSCWRFARCVALTVNKLGIVSRHFGQGIQEWTK